LLEAHQQTAYSLAYGFLFVSNRDHMEWLIGRVTTFTVDLLTSKQVLVTRDIDNLSGCLFGDSCTQTTRHQRLAYAKSHASVVARTAPLAGACSQRVNK